MAARLISCIQFDLYQSSFIITQNPYNPNQQNCFIDVLPAIPTSNRANFVLLFFRGAGLLDTERRYFNTKKFFVKLIETDAS